MADNITSMINQISDPATRQAVQGLFNHMKSVFDSHTHNADGSQGAAYYTSTPRTNAETVSAGTALKF